MAGDTIMTTPTAGVDEDPLMMYEPITKQMTKKVPFTTEPVLVTAKQAQQWLDEADAYEKFGQRPRTPAAIKRFQDLIESNRFVSYNPFGPLGFNEDGILMNGGNRLAAVASAGKSTGFIVIRNCPTWLINYIDNNKVRTVRDSMFINLKDVRPDTQAVMRLGMRYEEFIFGKRSELGWIEWAKVKDEHADLVNWINKREYVTDFIDQAKKLKKATNLQLPALACFIAYQQLAWPEDAADPVGKLGQFLEALQLGTMLSKGNPALTLREWGRNDGYIGGYSRGRREGHLLLLMKFFTLFAEGHTVADVRVARGLPMAMPYHPDGWEIACKNVRTTLVEMD